MMFNNKISLTAFKNVEYIQFGNMFDQPIESNLFSKCTKISAFNQHAIIKIK
jgi:hypothetical protein